MRFFNFSEKRKDTSDDLLGLGSNNSSASTTSSASSIGHKGAKRSRRLIFVLIGLVALGLQNLEKG